MKQKGLNNLLGGIGTGIIVVLSPIITILNIGSGLVGGIWVIVLGGWRLVVLSLIAGFILPYLYTLVTLPSMGIGLLAIKAAEKRWNFVAFILIAITTFYDKFILMLWVSYILGIVIQLRGDMNIIPYLLLGYATVMAPLASMARGEDNDAFGTWFSLFFAEFAYIVSGIFILLNVSSMTIAGYQWLIFFIFAIIQLFIVQKVLKALNNQNEVTNDNETTSDTDVSSDTDPIYREVVKYAMTHEVSETILQDKFHVGYARAARLKNMLIDDGVVRVAEPQK